MASGSPKVKQASSRPPHQVHPGGELGHWAGQEGGERADGPGSHPAAEPCAWSTLLTEPSRCSP